MRYDGGLKQDGSNQGDAKQSNSGCILKVEPTCLAADLDVAQERKKSQGSLEIFGLSNWKNRVTITGESKDCKEVGWEGIYRTSVLDMLALRCQKLTKRMW